ncbi:MAG: ester cyclase [Cyanobacteria bacterium J06649_4]
MSNINLDVALKFYEVYNANNLELLSEILADDYVGHVNAHDIKGAEAAKGFIGGFLEGIPDANYEVVDTLVTGNKVITRWICTGTQTGNFFGSAPTGKAIDVTGITIFEIVEGKISQLWNNWDQFTMVQQLQA